MRYGIVGTGGIGGYYGAKLAKGGKDVHFLLHSDYEFVSHNGLRIDSKDGNFELKELHIYNHSNQMPQCDVILVCMKTTNNSLLKTILFPILKSDSVIILIQNGLGMEEDVQEMFPEAKIVGGMAFICARKTSPGHIEHLDEGRINLGGYSEHLDKLQLLDIVSDFQEVGIDADLVDLAVARWNKLVWNIPFNGMSVVLNAQTDELLNNKSTRLLIYELMQEVIQAAHYLGLPLLPGLADKMIDYTDNMIPYSPSMKLDFEQGREMEVHYIYTKPLAVATLAGIDMPKVAMLEKQLRFIQSRYINNER